MKKILAALTAVTAAIALIWIAPAASGAVAKKPSAQAKKPSKPGSKRYASSAGKPPSKPAIVKTRPKPKPRAAAAPPTTASAKARVLAHEAVFQNVASGADIPVENAAALIPFFEQLYRHQRGEMEGPVRILHYGDSHTAADEWTGEMRARFQERFGNGGSGYSLAGRPYNGYRRLDLRSGSTRGWHSDGLAGRQGDGIYGLGGISMTTSSPREAVYLEADASSFELFFYRQPGGGSLQLYDNGAPLEQVSTDGEPGAGYYRVDATPGPHKFEVETLARAPVRLFGWVAENPTGVTYETLGINGAEASIILNWDETTLRSNIQRRDPALIVLAYGTNEAGHKDWNFENYHEMFARLIAGLRAAAPAATILVIGPPDRQQRVRNRSWVTLDKLDMIVDAQRQAAYEAGCPFWDLRAKMGGKGSIAQWVSAGMAQSDHVHFTGPGYRMLGDAVFRDLMSQYEIFLKARAGSLAAADPPVASVGN
jgi:lysophospholipase L1-like esterase